MEALGYIAVVLLICVKVQVMQTQLPNVSKKHGRTLIMEALD